MSERDELRRRCDEAVWAELWPESQLDHSSSDGDEIRLCVDAVLAEIERTHVMVPLPGCECEDCYPELTAAVGRPLPDGVTSVTWGWGAIPPVPPASDGSSR